MGFIKYIDTYRIDTQSNLNFSPYASGDDDALARYIPPRHPWTDDNKVPKPYAGQSTQARYDVLHITILYHMQSDYFPGDISGNSVEHLMLLTIRARFLDDSDRGDYQTTIGHN